jgi:enoyl-CoA hydratase/carnithine racemase
MTGTVLTEDAGGGVRIVTLNRPHRLNAIALELLEDLLAALRAADSDPAEGCMVLTGAGRAFCSGDDLKEFGSQAGDETATRAYIERIQDVTRAMVLGDTPVVGAIHGWAVGGGLEWVINCDFAIVAQGARFFFPEVSLGVFVTGGVTELLPRLVGLQRARELIMLGEKFDAAQAHAWGLVHKIAPDTEFMTEALALARRIAALPAGPVRDLRRILARRQDAGLIAAMAAETDATVRGFMDPDTARRVGAFG